MRNHLITAGVPVAIASCIVIAAMTATATTKPACDPGIPASKVVIKAITLASAKVISSFNSSACGAAATIHQLCDQTGGWVGMVAVPNIWDGVTLQYTQAQPSDAINAQELLALPYGVSYTPNNEPGTGEYSECYGDYNCGLAEVGGFGWACIGYSNSAPQLYTLNYSLGDQCFMLDWPGTMQNQGDGAGFCMTAYTVTSDGLMHVWELDATIDDSGLVDATTGLPLRGDHITLAADVWTDSPTFDADYNPCGQ
jgi:hypothetical protein